MVGKFFGHVDLRSLCHYFDISTEHRSSEVNVLIPTVKGNHESHFLSTAITVSRIDL